MVRLFHADQGKFLTADRSPSGTGIVVFLRNTARTSKAAPHPFFSPLPYQPADLRHYRTYPPPPLSLMSV